MMPDEIYERKYIDSCYTRISTHPNGFCMFVRASFMENNKFISVIEKFKGEGSVLIYSMWEGYLEESEPYGDADISEFADQAKANNCEVINLHTSGHAYGKAIKDLIDDIVTPKVVIPIHGEDSRNFDTLGISARIVHMQDGQIYDLENGKISGRGMPRWYTSESGRERFPYSSAISEIKKSGRILSFKVNNPGANMQTDIANFESIALICRCIEPGCAVEIDFALSRWEETITRNNVRQVETFAGWNGEFGQETPGSNAYMRFLYRAYCFKLAYGDWVRFSEVASEEIEKFAKKLMDLQLSNNIPDKMAIFNVNKGREHVLEHKLTYTKEGNEYLSKLYEGTNDGFETINNQLPCGLFDVSETKKPSNKTRIFSTGFIDIWLKLRR